MQVPSNPRRSESDSHLCVRYLNDSHIVDMIQGGLSLERLRFHIEILISIWLCGWRLLFDTPIQKNWVRVTQVLGFHVFFFFVFFFYNNAFMHLSW